MFSIYQEAKTRFNIEQEGVIEPVAVFPSKIAARAYLEARNAGKTHDEAMLKANRAEKQRKKRNQNAKERNDAMRSLGLVKTPYGWE